MCVSQKSNQPVGVVCALMLRRWFESFDLRSIFSSFLTSNNVEVRKAMSTIKNIPFATASSLSSASDVQRILDTKASAVAAAASEVAALDSDDDDEEDHDDEVPVAAPISMPRPAAPPPPGIRRMPRKRPEEEVQSDLRDLLSRVSTVRHAISGVAHDTRWKKYDEKRGDERYVASIAAARTLVAEIAYAEHRTPDAYHVRLNMMTDVLSKAVESLEASRQSLVAIKVEASVVEPVAVVAAAA